MNFESSPNKCTNKFNTHFKRSTTDGWMAFSWHAHNKFYHRINVHKLKLCVDGQQGHLYWLLLLIKFGENVRCLCLSLTINLLDVRYWLGWATFRNSYHEILIHYSVKSFENWNLNYRIITKLHSQILDAQIEIPIRDRQT